MGINTAVSPIIYGLVRFLAWGDQFPTTTERSLWRASSFVATSSGIVGVIFLWSFMWLDQRSNSRFSLDVLAAIMYTVVIPAVHMLASGFLIVESFRQLCYLDLAAYRLPSLPNYWPHLS